MGSVIPDYEFVVEGLDEQIKLFDREPFIVNDELKTAMLSSVKTIEERAFELAPVDQGYLKSTIGSEVREISLLSIVGRVGSTMKDKEYPKVMEFGRKPGKFPPPLDGQTKPWVSVMERWVRLVIRPPKKELKQVTFLIGRSIARKGIKGRRYLQGAWEDKKDSVEKFFAQAVERIAERLSNGRN